MPGRHLAYLFSALSCFPIIYLEVLEEKSQRWFFAGKTYLHVIEREDNKVFYQRFSLPNANEEPSGEKIVPVKNFGGEVNLEELFLFEIENVVAEKWGETGFVACVSYWDREQVKMFWIAKSELKFTYGKMSTPDKNLYYTPASLYASDGSDMLDIIIREHQSPERDDRPRLLQYHHTCVSVSSFEEDSGHWNLLRLSEQIKDADPIDGEN